ncbi:MAG: redoxin domain-containing protein [Sphingobacteriales bacterium]|uniref:peroxiredoxin family protein n=1 Tax=Hydrotalea flava TaxID=714549 RepID=UPI0008335397|nr:redoxin domain-containing protein [Hydrotalea flava]NIN02621.1 redoxin domain-containing protein [Hydrotalea flava]RTL49260.1 MAG: redoxin domain-containing protein [Sphingobacteriales bacterium]
MLRFQRNIFLILSLLMMAVMADAQLPAPAKSIPDFQLYQFNGQPFVRDNLPKNKLLFFIFFDVTCDHCQHAFREINAHYNAMKGVAMYLISLDSEASMANFITRFAPNLVGKPNITLLRDVQNQFIQQFTPRKYPSMFLYNAKRQLLLYDDEPEHFQQFLQAIHSNTYA